MWTIYFAWAVKAPAVSESISFTRYKMSIDDCYIQKMQHTLSIAVQAKRKKEPCVYIVQLGEYVSRWDEMSWDEMGQVRTALKLRERKH